MIPAWWQTDSLVVQDALPADADDAYRAHQECHDVGALDPAFLPVPKAEIDDLIARSAGARAPAERTFQMQMLRLRRSGELAGYWHFQQVPSEPTAAGVSILLIRPAFRRLGLGRELVGGAAPYLARTKQQLWARVYLANPRAIAFWSQQGLVRLARLHGRHVSSPEERPSIILARDLHADPGSAEPEPRARVVVARETPEQADAVALVGALDADQDTLYPPEARHALDLAALAAANGVFVVARDARGQAMGCGAVVFEAGFGELKRLYVRPADRGHGVATRIVAALEAAAAERGCREIRLETGPRQPEALAFYRREGYAPCGPFGAYPEHPLSVFMAKTLAPRAAGA